MSTFSTVEEISYKSLSIITLLSIKQMAILHLFLCGVMKGIFMMLSRSLRDYFDGTNTHEHLHNALDTSCDSKLHHHGNHYQEERVMKEWMEEGEDRSRELQQDRERWGKEGAERQRRVHAQRVETQRRHDTPTQ